VASEEPRRLAGKIQSRHMEYADNGIWIHGASEVAGHSIRRAVFEFRAKHNLADSAWQLRVYAVGQIYLDVWIGKPPAPTYREPHTILDDGEAGTKVLDLLEHLRSASS
jgi:hypothetical protein